MLTSFNFCFKMCVFLGYRPSHKGYECLDCTSRRIYISHDVVFNKNIFPYATPHMFPDLSRLNSPVSFPVDEPVTQDGAKQNYDLSVITFDDSSPCYAHVHVFFPEAIIVADNLYGPGPVTAQLNTLSTGPSTAAPRSVMGQQDNLRPDTFPRSVGSGPTRSPESNSNQPTNRRT